MIRSKDRWSTLSRSAGCWMLGAGAGALALALVAPVALAQQAQPKSTAAPKKAPVAALPAAGQSAGDDWVKLCLKNEHSGNKEICLVNHEGLEPNTGMVLVTAAVRKVEGEDKQQLLIGVSTAYALVIQAGVQVDIDEEKPIHLQYAICFPMRCQVQMELTDELFKKMRSGKQMVVKPMNIQQKTMSFLVPLTGFSKAYDGPAFDNATYEAQRKQLMEVLRKRQADLAAKAKQGQQKGAAAPAAPGNTAKQKQAPAPQ